MTGMTLRKAGILLVMAVGMIVFGCGGQHTDSEGDAAVRPPRSSDALRVRSGGASVHGSGAAGIPGSTMRTGADGGFSAMGLDHDGLFVPLVQNERADTAGLGDFGYGIVGLAQRWDGRN